MQDAGDRRACLRRWDLSLVLFAGAGSGSDRGLDHYRRRIYLLFREVSDPLHEVLLMKIVVVRSPRFLAPLLRRLFHIGRKDA